MMNTKNLFCILAFTSLVGAHGALAMGKPVPGDGSGANQPSNPTGGSKPKPTSGGCCHAAHGMKDGKAYKSKSTGYYPANNAMEGGFVDKKGYQLRTLQQFSKGKAAYVSTAMDPKVFAYGQPICIPEINSDMGQAIAFKVVDTGGAFKGKGTSRIDICTSSEANSLSDMVNRQLTIIVCE
jgi:3D (Asp-Asp-Asp) domain-containing protein